ncbi:putative Protein SMG8 [Hypsibius exemplaris]|uniref:Nonsense-mediated mRNA decay factor SMG8 n=1 Tax=Hypsibius exemplaris TaxID=2072580 RepID=A0A1W0WY63_HYPEX|nr:putative Protein SMG8 [Hypsibius exemplaris]
MDSGVDPSLEWIRIDIGYLDSTSLQALSRFVARNSTSNPPAFIALVGSVNSKTSLEDSPEIQAILDNTLPCYVLAKASDDLDYVPASAVSVYHRMGTDVFYLRVHGRSVDVVQNVAKRAFSTDQDPADEIELDLAEQDSEYSRLLVFVFALSHTILWFQSDSLFSNYELRLLKIVDLARLRGQKSISKVFSGLTTFTDWIREGCICCPRLVFVFSGLPRGITSSDKLATKKAEQDCSVRLYTVLKKCRLISIPRSSGLCFLSAKKEIVVFAKDRQHCLCIFPNSKESDTDKAKMSEFFLPTTTTKPATTELGNRNPLTDFDRFSEPNSFARMLATCTKDILNANSVSAGLRPSGFAWPSHFYRPSVSEWFLAAIQLHSLLFHGEEFRSLLDSKLGCAMSISRKYSRSVAAFTASSFTLRTSDSSVRQIRNCLHSYMQFARGPALKGFGVALTTYLSNNAKSRRQCSAVSLYGSRCIKQIHWTPAQFAILPPKLRKNRLPVLRHQSSGTLMGFCSCGRTAHQRPEPFNIREANEQFYEMMDLNCCGQLENRIDFPSVSRKDLTPKEEKKPEVTTLKRYDSFPELHTAVQLNDKDISQPYINVVVEPSSEPPGTLVIVPKAKRHPQMFQLGMSYDVAPKISSWVAYGLGPSSRYRHAYGLEHHLQADFLNLYHHLLPIDAEIVLARTHRMVKHLPNRPTQIQTIEPRPWHSLIYFGLDYECPKGHRFMYKSKEVYDMSSNGRIDAAQAVAEDILLHGAPLFMRCPCKGAEENRHFIAQLMRIHVVTPKDPNEPLRLGIFPKIKTGRAIPAFTPGLPTPVILGPGTYWVLRLPFSYYDSVRGRGPFCAPRISYPKHRKLPCSGSLLGGFITFAESDSDTV